MKRRTLLLSGAGLTGALPARSRLDSANLLAIDNADASIALNGWIKITPDGGVVLAMARSEMGQGVHTALAMLVAEELDVPLARVSLVQAGSDAIYGNVAMIVGSLPFHPAELGGDDKLATPPSQAQSVDGGQGGARAGHSCHRGFVQHGRRLGTTALGCGHGQSGLIGCGFFAVEVAFGRA